MLLLGLVTVAAESQDRVPRPEFETGYEIPQLTVPEARSNILEFLDVVVLIGALALSAFLAIKLRKRTALFWLTVFSVAYLGFFRKGCICPVGATQNVVLALFQPGYIIPISAVIFFVLPLLSALFFGRTFCSSVCPLGAVQELVIYKPLKVPEWIARPLGFVPVLYLGFTVLFAATGSEFIICRFDPFVSQRGRASGHLAHFAHERIQQIDIVYGLVHIGTAAVQRPGSPPSAAVVILLSAPPFHIRIG